MTSRKSGQRNRKRQHLLETLESRQMLAGPQLIGIQPNEGDLIVDGSIRNVAPRSLTFRFDEVQQIDPSTFDGIEITRSGADRTFGTTDDVVIAPGLVTLGDIRQNEVVVRFAENLPDDNYRIDLFAFDDPDRGIVALRNTAGEIIQPSTPGARTETVNFQLNLGALVEAIVPQPVVRQADGSLRQFRNEILVYFNEDTLFVENDPATGQPTARSAENPRFYQLLLTQESVRTTDDVLYFPDRVIYDAATNTSRLIFADDINNLPGVPLGGGTFRLRVGTAVGTRSDLILPPTNFAIAPSVTSDLRIDPDLAVTFRSKVIGEAASGRTISFVNTGAGGLSVSVTSGGNIVFNLGGSTPTVANLASIVAATPAVNAVLSVTFALDGVAGNGGNLVVPANIVSAPPLVMTAVGDTITSSLDVGTFGLAGQSVTSLTLRESIDPRPFLIELPGGTDDPGRLEIPEFSGNGLLQTINENFGADTTSGITEIPYNFKDVFETFGGVSQLNQVGTNELYKTRIREALSLWANYIGVQFRETTDSGITFAFGDPATLRPRPNTQLTNLGVLNASLRIDPTFANSAMVFSNQATFGTAYGQDLFRKAMAGIGFLLGLEGATDLTAQSLMSLNPGYLNATINPINPDGSTNYGQLTDLEPSFPGNYDILHGRYVHRTDSIDVDMYRFEVNLGVGQRVGTLTAETFAERLADSSLLDTTLTLFRDVPASVVTDFGVGTTLAVQITSVQPGALGNSANISYLRTDRAAGDDAIRIRRALDDNGQPTANGIVIDVPRQSANVTTVTADDVIDAINNDPFASTLFHAEILRGEGSANIIGSPLTNSLSLSGGGIEQVSRNDDYFSEDSLLRVTLSNGVYYLGVAASGNNTYDPTIPGSGFGGLTQGKYELLLKFEPQVNESDTLRDLDSARVGVPGTAIDGDGDGVPGGANNFWFQTRPLDRTIAVTGNGAAITPRQTFTITGANGQVRRFEFVPQVGTNFGTPSPGFIAINYNPGASGGGTGSPTPAANIAASIRSAIASVTNETGVRATTSPTSNSVLVLTGERTITFSSNFRGADVLGRTIFVDKTASVTADGSLDNPFNNISNPAVPNAFGATRENDIVRIVGNGGLDNNPSTTVDNFSYRIGTTETGGATLEDGRNMQVPQGVTVMIDAGAAFKLRNSAISVGSTSLTVDRSGGALQVLGTPRLVDLSDPVIVSGTVTNRGIALRPGSGDVVFTSTRDASVDAAASGSATTPAPGNWGGLIFRRDLDQAEGRTDLEDEGIFLQSVNHADIRFGGGANILIDAVQQAVNPIQLINLRPNITFNTISNSANAAMSAAPDSFEETSYQAPRFQAAGAFTADYDRVGPEINNNLLVNNSINGLFVRVETSTTTAPRQLTVAGRFDDIDIVHYIADNIIVAGTPGGSLQDGVVPDVSSISAQVLAGGSLAAGTYNYRITFVDAFGFESLGSLPTADVTVPAGSSINLITLPQVDDDLDYLFRRVYRRDLDGVYRVAGQLDASDNQFIDDGSRSGSPLNLARLGVRGRLDGSLVVDPGSVLKFRGARIELGQGTQLLAEGTASKPIVFTSSLDDRFGAGGSFDTNNDINTPNGAANPARGDWSGIYAGPTANVSFDFSTIAYGGGVSLIEGGQSRGFDALELHQATARVTNSRFEFNANGQAGAGPVGRNGRLGITPATIFARFTQPTIVGNTFVDNRGSIIDLDSDSFNDSFLVDLGRQTGLVERLSDLDDNQGPLIRRNVTDSVASDSAAAQQLNGLKVRGGILSTGSVWDDTDIVHVLNDTIIVGNLISNSGLRLKSRPDEGLVVKLSGAGTPNSPTIGTGFTATGSTSNISDRIGGTVQVIGLPGAPVVMTSIFDDTVGAGRRIDGTQQTDTNGDSFG
ncbi:MAG: peptidase, partial [Planctomycetaceae bacterium]